MPNAQETGTGCIGIVVGVSIDVDQRVELGPGSSDRDPLDRSLSKSRSDADMVSFRFPRRPRRRLRTSNASLSRVSAPSKSTIATRSPGPRLTGGREQEQEIGKIC